MQRPEIAPRRHGSTEKSLGRITLPPPCFGSNVSVEKTVPWCSLGRWFRLPQLELAFAQSRLGHRDAQFLLVTSDQAPLLFRHQ